MVLWLIACSPSDPMTWDDPTLDTALPAVVTVPTPDSGEADTGLDPAYYDESGRYIGPPMLAMVHQSCEGGEWTVWVETRGDENGVRMLQWNLGTAPEDREPGTDHGAGFYNRTSLDMHSWLDVERPVNGIRYVSDWERLNAPPRPDCSEDVDAPDLVVALETRNPWTHDPSMHCVMFGPDAAEVRADPEYHRSYEGGRYNVDRSFQEQIQRCIVIPWPRTPHTFHPSEFPG